MGGDLGRANGHGWHEQPTPHQLTALVGQRVKLVCAGGITSCAVTEKGEFYTWGAGASGQLGHGDEEHQLTPKRVEGLNGVKVAAAAICDTHTVVADKDGVVWAFGDRMFLGLGGPDADPDSYPLVLEPAQIPTLRVRALKSPDALPFR